jgi:hypothetical protein
MVMKADMEVVVMAEEEATEAVAAVEATAGIAMRNQSTFLVLQVLQAQQVRLVTREIPVHRVTLVLLGHQVIPVRMVLRDHTVKEDLQENQAMMAFRGNKEYLVKEVRIRALL